MARRTPSTPESRDRLRGATGRQASGSSAARPTRAPRNPAATANHRPTRNAAKAAPRPTRASRNATATAAHRSAAGRAKGGRAKAGWLSASPYLRIALGAVALVLVLMAILLVSDVVGNFGRIHSGVVIQGVDVGGLSREQAAERLESELGGLLAATPVDLFADEQTASEGVSNDTVELTSSSTAYDASEDYIGKHSWRISSATVGVSVNGASLAEEAYAVGRGADFLGGRLTARFFGLELKASLQYDQAQLAALEVLLSEALGFPMVNADINFVEGSFVVMPGSEGMIVDHQQFQSILDEAFLSAQRGQLVPMRVQPVDVSNQQAQELADHAQAAIAQPVALVYSNEDSWNLDSFSLGSWVGTRVDGSGGDARLVAFVKQEWLEQGIHGFIGDRYPGTAPQNARFEVANDQINVIPSQKGTGINYAQVAADLDKILFPAGQPVKDRRVSMTVTDLEPALSTEAAQAMNIKDKVASYTTDYTIASGAKVTNIHLAADLLNNSLVEPGGIWSFNDTAGECNAARGFQEATSIVEGEYVDEIGGGICQVATTVFNAVYESGLPVAERVNHGLYLLAYPAGRDAAVSWRWPDLKFENDTGHWLLLTLSYTDNTLTCTLWGTSPGYRVESEDTGFTDRTDFKSKEVENPELPKGEKRVKQEGVRGRSIVVTRYVYNRDGQLLRKTDFKSVYAPETEIIEIGTKETAPASPADGAGTAGNTAGGSP